MGAVVRCGCRVGFRLDLTPGVTDPQGRCEAQVVRRLRKTVGPAGVSCSRTGCVADVLTNQDRDAAGYLVGDKDIRRRYGLVGGAVDAGGYRSPAEHERIVHAVLDPAH